MFQPFTKFLPWWSRMMSRGSEDFLRREHLEAVIKEPVAVIPPKPRRTELGLPFYTEDRKTEFIIEFNEKLNLNTMG